MCPPIRAVQSEYSLWRREAELDLQPTLRELGIGLVSWTPLESGFLSGTVTSLSKDDFRQNNPRDAGDNLALNRDRFLPFMKVAEQLGITPAQLVLAWLAGPGAGCLSTPGTRRSDRADENAQAADIRLTPDLLNRTMNWLELASRKVQRWSDCLSSSNRLQRPPQNLDGTDACDGPGASARVGRAQGDVA